MKTGNVHRNVTSFLNNIFSEIFLIKVREAGLLFNGDTQGDYEHPPKCRTAGTELHLPCPSCRRATELRFSISCLCDLTCSPWRTGPAGVTQAPEQAGFRGTSPNTLREAFLIRADSPSGVEFNVVRVAASLRSWVFLVLQRL